MPTHPLPKLWPERAADWPKIARPPTAGVRSEWPKETAMTEIDSVLDPFVDPEINEHHAALIRQIVAIGSMICLLLLLIGLHG
jgi:hypothetical protein